MSTDVNERLISLEMTVAHLEHDLQQMHSVLLAMQAELRGSRDHIQKLEQRIIAATETPENRSPLDERPPHY